MITGIALAIPAHAQEDPDKVQAGLAAWKAGGCSACHSTFGTGGGDGGAPDGPSLRETDLDRAAIVETISCGRPGTAMPYNLVGAYTEVACYGIEGGVPEETAEGKGFSAEEIDALVAYLTERVVGQGDVTGEDCAFYYGNPRHPLCRAYR